VLIPANIFLVPANIFLQKSTVYVIDEKYEQQSPMHWSLWHST